MVIFLLVVTAVLWGATPIMEKVGLAKVDPLIGVTVRSAIVTLCLLLVVLIMGKTRELIETDGRNLLLFGGSGIMAGFLGMWTYYIALRMGTTSRIVPIAACYPLVTALLSFLVLKEEVTLPRAVGTALIVSGIWLVK